MASSDWFVTLGEDEEDILYSISNIFAKPQVFSCLVFDAKIFDIIYQLSPWVTLLFSGSQTVGSHSNKGDNCIVVNDILCI